MPFSKYIFPESFNFGVNPVQIIGDSKGGFDKCAMKKRNVSRKFDDEDFPRKKGYTYLHIITTGAEDTYGPNANGDGWVWDHKTVKASDPKDKDHESMRLDGGLKKYHNDRFENHGEVFKEHVTRRQGAKPSGYVVKAAVNDEMRRGELIIAVDNNLWSEELDKKDKGGNIYFSIGADVPRDVCSICLNSASKRSEYCDHVKHHLLELTDDGSRVYTYNDTPMFYDISGVATPADQIAFALRDLTEGHSKSASMKIPSFRNVIGKQAVYKKLAVLSKRIPAMSVDDPLVEACSCDHEAENCMLDKVLGMYDTREILDALNRKGVLLSPEGLFRVLAEDTLDPSAKFTLLSTHDSDLDLCGIFDKILSSVEDVEDHSYDLDEIPSFSMLNMIEPFMTDLSLREEPVRTRSIRITISTKKKDKEGHSKEASISKRAASVLAKEYGKYVASFVDSYRGNSAELAICKIASIVR